MRKVLKSVKVRKNITETALHLPRNIKLVRELSGLNQTDFGRIFSATKAMVVSYESGKASPGMLFMLRLSALSGLTQEELLNKKLTEADIKLEKLDENVLHEPEADFKRGPEVSDHDKYVGLLERNNQVFEQSIQLSLNALLKGQQIELDALARIEAQLALVKEATGKSFQDGLKDEINKMFAAQELRQKGNAARS